MGVPSEDVMTINLTKQEADILMELLMGASFKGDICRVVVGLQEKIMPIAEAVVVPRLAEVPRIPDA